MSKPVVMPDPDVPRGSNDPRHSPDSDRAASMIDINFGPATILEEKIMNPDEVIPGGAGDETGIVAEIIRNYHQGR